MILAFQHKGVITGVGSIRAGVAGAGIVGAGAFGAVDTFDQSGTVMVTILIIVC